MLAIAVAAVGLASGASLAEEAVPASPCAADELPMPEVRFGADVKCMKKEDWRKAGEICRKQGKDDPAECVCRDGDVAKPCEG
ncbi:MAG: hypothetical protein NW216_13295 [Hyphomicrobium sp.]|nr:hypothetical protein [Hyphomicrobium sp.]